MRAFISEDDERKLVVSEDEEFVASYVYGEWFENKLLDLEEMRELDREDEFYEIGGLLRQAKKALRYH